jgi:TRAP-type C4-dicarboxylate transport system permease small subunit
VNRTLSRTQRAVEMLLVITLFVMVALTFVDVIGRRFFDKPVYGAHDMTEHLMALIVFAGLPVLTARREHLSIDLFDAWLLKPHFAWWHRVVDGLIAVTLGLISVEFFISAREASQIKEVSQALNIPRGLAYDFIGATSALAAVAALFVRNPARCGATAHGAALSQPAHGAEPSREVSP